MDSNDRERIDIAGDSGTTEDTAKGALYTMLADEQLQGVPLLVLANKQDLPNGHCAFKTALKVHRLKSLSFRPQITTWQPIESQLFIADHFQSHQWTSNWVNTSNAIGISI